MTDRTIPLRLADAVALGMSEAIVEKVYGHHDPRHLARAVNTR